MNPVIKKHMHTIHEEIKKAQDSIYERTGVKCLLMPRIYIGTFEGKIKVLFQQMCHEWGVSLDFVKDKSREGDIPSYKKLLWMAAKNKYPKASLMVIASLTNVDNHTTVMKGINTGYDLLGTQDSRFLKLYEPVKQFFNVTAEQ